MRWALNDDDTTVLRLWFLRYPLYNFHFSLSRPCPFRGIAFRQPISGHRLGETTGVVARRSSTLHHRNKKWRVLVFFFYTGYLTSSRRNRCLGSALLGAFASFYASLAALLPHSRPRGSCWQTTTSFPRRKLPTIGDPTKHIPFMNEQKTFMNFLYTRLHSCMLVSCFLNIILVYTIWR